MKLNIYSIYDNAAKFYSLPMFWHNDAVALRNAQNMMADGDSQIARFPENFVMFYLGEWDDEQAQITTKVPEVICKFHELKVNPHENNE